MTHFKGNEHPTGCLLTQWKYSLYAPVASALHHLVHLLRLSAHRARRCQHKHHYRPRHQHDFPRRIARLLAPVRSVASCIWLRDFRRLPQLRDARLSRHFSAHLLQHPHAHAPRLSMRTRRRPHLQYGDVSPGRTRSLSALAGLVQSAQEQEQADSFLSAACRRGRRSNGSHGRAVRRG